MRGATLLLLMAAALFGTSSKLATATEEATTTAETEANGTAMNEDFNSTTEASWWKTTQQDKDLETTDSSSVMVILQLTLGLIFFTFVFQNVIRGCRRCARMDGPVDPETGEYNVTCYLCNERVLNSVWNDASENGHRKTCHLRSLLNSMPLSSVWCRKCSRPMRLWPPNLPPNNPMFNCKEQHCFNRGLEIKNTGANRLNCFDCDYDMCGDCGKMEIQFNGGRVERSATIASPHNLERCNSTRGRKKKRNALKRTKSEREHSETESQMSYSREPSNSKVVRQESIWMLDAAELEDKLDREWNRRKSAKRSIRRKRQDELEMERGEDSGDMIETAIDYDN